MKVLHLNCSELTNSHFQSYQKGNIFLNWIYCSNYSPLKCEKQIYDNIDSVRCDKCDKWIHKTCANIKYIKYKDMQKNRPGEKTWLFNECLNLPSTSTDNKKLFLRYGNENNFTTNMGPTKFSTTCPTVFFYLSEENP